MIVRLASYTEFQNLWLAAQLIAKLSFTTGAIFAVPIFYGASKLVKALRVRAHDLLPNVVSIEEAKDQMRRAA